MSEVKQIRAVPDAGLTPIERLRCVVVRDGQERGEQLPFEVDIFDPEDELKALLGGRDPHRCISEAASHTAWGGRLFVNGFYPRHGSALLEALNLFPMPDSVAARWLVPAVLAMLDPPMTVDEYFQLEGIWFGQRHELIDPDGRYLAENWDGLEDWTLRCFVDYPLVRMDRVTRLQGVVRTGIRRLRESHDLMFDRMLHPIKRLLIQVLEGGVDLESPTQFAFRGGQKVRIAPDRVEIQRLCRSWFEDLQLALIPSRPSIAPAVIDIDHVRRYDSLLETVVQIWKVTQGQRASSLRREALQEEFYFLVERYWPVVATFWKECGDLGKVPAHEVAARLLCLLSGLRLSPQRVRSKIAEIRRRERLSRTHRKMTPTTDV